MRGVRAKTIKTMTTSIEDRKSGSCSKKASGIKNGHCDEKTSSKCQYPSVSVIIPIYNASEYISKCIESIKESDYPDIEVLLVNDGSSDNSLDICRSLEKNYSWIKVLDKPNGGVSTARNAGLIKAKGDYVTFVDVDDYLGDNFFSPLKCAKEDIIFLQYKCFDEAGNITDGENVPLLPTTYSRSDIRKYLASWLHQNIMRTPWGKFIRREVIGNITFPIGQKIGEDSVFIFNILARIKSMRTVDDVYYMWRTHSDCFIQKYQLPVNTAIKYLVNEIQAYKNIGVKSNKLEKVLYFTFYVLSEKYIGVFRWKWFARPVIYKIWMEIESEYKNRHKKKFEKYKWLRPYYALVDRKKVFN